MASVVKHPSGWLARVRRGGVRRSATFLRKADAEAWARKIEDDIVAGRLGAVPDRPFRALVERYINEVVALREAGRPERLRLMRLIRDDALASVSLTQIAPADVAAWRDRRLRQVSAAAVSREWTSLSAACTRAIREWGWLKVNPFVGVSRPADAPPRARRVSPDETERILLALGFDYEARCETVQARVAAAFLWAIETAMRAGEICALRMADVDRAARVARVRAEDAGARKTGTARTVPLSTRALALLDQLPAADSVFDLKPAQIDVFFRRARDRAMLADLHFHDTRREALTRLAAKVDVMTLAKISGHRDLRILQAVYYAPDMSEVATRLD